MIGKQEYVDDYLNNYTSNGEVISSVEMDCLYFEIGFNVDFNQDPRTMARELTDILNKACQDWISSK